MQSVCLRLRCPSIKVICLSIAILIILVNLQGSLIQRISNLHGRLVTRPFTDRDILIARNDSLTTSLRIIRTAKREPNMTSLQPKILVHGPSGNQTQVNQSNQTNQSVTQIRANQLLNRSPAAQIKSTKLGDELDKDSEKKKPTAISLEGIASLHEKTHNFVKPPLTEPEVNPRFVKKAEPRVVKKADPRVQRMLTQLKYSADLFSTAYNSGAKSFNIDNKNFCQMVESIDLDLLIWIHSAPGNFERRNAVRTLWASPKHFLPLKVKAVFGIGRVENQVVQTSLEAEHKTFQDLVQDFSYLDSYQNLTFKTQSMLRWVDTFCPNTRHVMKTDDDTLILPQRLTNWYNDSLRNGGFNDTAIYGNIWNNPKPQSLQSKWYTPKEVWPFHVFSTAACPGLGYFISRPAVPKLLETAQTAPFLWLEDMYLTGVIAQAAEIPLRNLAIFYSVYHKTWTYRILKIKKRIFIVGHVDQIADYLKLAKLYF